MQIVAVLSERLGTIVHKLPYQIFTAAPAAERVNRLQDKSHLTRIQITHNLITPSDYSVS